MIHFIDIISDWKYGSEYNTVFCFENEDIGYGHFCDKVSFREKRVEKEVDSFFESMTQ